VIVKKSGKVILHKSGVYTLEGFEFDCEGREIDLDVFATIAMLAGAPVVTYGAGCTACRAVIVFDETPAGDGRPGKTP